ncbi:MAG: tetratricopeptide repeat protein [Anaerolineaceae bacterium]|nr:tetratricopeptide repeat protein [Anaerolineaceae bacterium]
MPNWAEYFFEQGLTWWEQDELDIAITCFAQAIQYDPHYLDAFLNRGAANQFRGDYVGAISDYTDALRLRPAQHILPWLFHMRGMSYEALGHHNTALTDYDTAIQKDAAYVDAYRSRGYVRGQMGDLEGATADLTEVLRHFPDDPNLYNERGNLHADQGLMDEAIADYSQALRCNPQDDYALYNRGITYAFQNKLQEAIADYTRVIELVPDLAVAYNNRGNAYHRLGDIAHAMADYSQAIQFDPNFSLAYRNRADIRQQINDIPGAIDDYRKATYLSYNEQK